MYKNYVDNMRLSGYKKVMKAEARIFKSLADETRLKILWLLMNQEELCVCDIMAVLGITQSKASRHLRYLYHLGWVTDRREGVSMNYRLNVSPGSLEAMQLELLGEVLSTNAEAKALQERLQQWLSTKSVPASFSETVVCRC